MGWEPVVNCEQDACRVGISGLGIFRHVLAWSNSKWYICRIVDCFHLDYVVITKGNLQHLRLGLSINDEIVIQSLPSASV